LFLAQANTNGIRIHLPWPMRRAHLRKWPAMGKTATLLLAVFATTDMGIQTAPPRSRRVMADGPDTLYDLPKASIIVLRGSLRPQ
jgi:hypothetical protein